MIRRQARQRRDYLYRRAQSLRAAETAARRSLLKSALASGKPLPAHLARDAKLRADYKYDESQPSTSANPNDPNAAAQAQADLLALDDEYAHASGLADPRVVVTTSRSPSTRLSAFAKEVRLLLPTSVRLNRGALVLPERASAARAAGLTDIVLLHERRGEPAALTISHLPHGPMASFSLHRVSLRHDLAAAARGAVSEAYPHLIFEGFETALGQRVARILKHLWPPREDVSGGQGKVGSRVVTFRNADDAVEVRHHVFVRTGREGVELAEVGPRITMRLFEIRGGTVESREGDVEWHLNQYTRTARKKNYL